MKKNKRQIGILGGSFDPIHMGHIGLAQETRDKFDLDQILFIPVFQSPHKASSPLASTSDRMKMLQLALKNNASFSICDVETCRNELSYTIDTLNYLEREIPDSELFLIIGQDNLQSLDSWKDSRRIMERYHILVASRPGLKSFSPEEKVSSLFNGDSPYRPGKTGNGKQEFLHRKTESRLVIYQISPRDISSSAIRKKIVHGEIPKNLLPPEVEAYIIKHQIYKTKT